MANRNYTQFQYGLEKMPVKLRAVVNIGAAGAPTLQQWVPSSGGGGAYSAALTGGTRGIKSITRNGTGDYTLTLQDPFQRLLEFDAIFIAPTNTKAAAPTISIQATGTTLGTSTGGTIRFFTQSSTNTAADPASGEQMLIVVEVSNSTAP